MKLESMAKSKGQMLSIIHVATGVSTEFPAIIKNFSDSYDVSWDTINVYGRMDAIKPYRSTTRSITVSVDVISEDQDHAKENLKKYSRLIKMLYPVYSEPLRQTAGDSRTIKAPPLLRIKMMNYIQSGATMADGDVSQGLLGCISGLKFEPKFDMGHYVSTSGELTPVTFDISFQFVPLHEDVLGFLAEDQGSFGSKAFPYNAADELSLLGGD